MDKPRLARAYQGRRRMIVILFLMYNQMFTHTIQFTLEVTGRYDARSWGVKANFRFGLASRE